MEFMQVLSERHAIRSYKSDPIPDSVLENLFKAISLAPSGNNRQAYKFIFVKDAETRRRIAKEACHQDFLGESPVLMAACCEAGRSFDTAIAVDHMVLAATNEGLGTCWVGWIERPVIKEILGIPDAMEVPIMVALGYKNEGPAPKEKKTIEQLISIDRF